MKVGTIIFALTPFLLDALIWLYRDLGAALMITVFSVLVSVMGMIWGASISRHRLPWGLGCIAIGAVQILLLGFLATHLWLGVID